MKVFGEFTVSLKPLVAYADAQDGKHFYEFEYQLI